MQTLRTVAEASAAARALPRPVGLVPTMGALHRGHLALVEAARRECASVVASIFVNPLQFGPGEDFDRYPRAFDADRAALAEHGVTLVFAPPVEAMYPAGFATAVDPGPVASGYEGALRPGHFNGVATVCTKLFLVTGADRAFFGAKDAQQNAVIARVIADLDLPIVQRVMPTVRESDGLALSSRNVYLTADERAAAPGLAAALQSMAADVARGDDNTDAILARARVHLAAPLREAYLDIVDPRDFSPRRDGASPALAIGSAWLGATRLLDNVAIGAL